ncbi:MAG: hypothetical protein LBK99_06575 [Opitutaceae bacterium]|jgi:RIO-like serine/threonine protein kinase|nr:hypothetical protein [Opitutaceae bacterium]
MAETTMILRLLSAYFRGQVFEPPNLTLLKAGRFGNACVFRYHDGHCDWIIKDFHHSPWPVRWTAARFFVRQEYRALVRLHGVKGVATEAHRLSPWTIAYPFIKGTPLAVLPPHSVPKPFFLQMETLVAAMHARSVVHLDLRNLGNILRGDDGHPRVIDFQSAFHLPRWCPRWMQRILCNADTSGIYKAWCRRGEEPLDAGREAFLERVNRVRKFWVLRGYPFSRAWRWLKGKFSR